MSNRTWDLRKKIERTSDLVKKFKRTLDLRGEGVIPSFILSIGAAHFLEIHFYSITFTDY